MTNVKINPGICGLVTCISASSEDKMEVSVNVNSSCAAVTKMFSELGTNFDSFDLCLKKPGEGLFYEYASKNFPGHCSCPTIAGITKAIEVECSLALPKDVSITFE